MTDNPVIIKAKASAIQWWKPKMNVSDFYIVDNVFDWTITKIISQTVPEGDLKLVKVVLAYFSHKQNRTRTKTVYFEFGRSKNESLVNVLNSAHFVVDKSILDSYSFVSLNENNIKVLNPNINMKGAHVERWSLFKRKVWIRVDFTILGIEKEFLLEEDLNINPYEVILHLLDIDEESTKLVINDNFEFELESFSPVLKSYKTFFGEEDEAQLKEVVDSILIINPKITANKVNIFSENSIADFVGTIILGDNKFQNFKFKAMYDATDLQQSIINRLSELTVREHIIGFPRHENIKLKDIFVEWDKLYLKNVLGKLGLYGIIKDNVFIESQTYDIENNTLKVDINFENADETNIFQFEIPFEFSPIDYAKEKIENGMFILKNESILHSHPVNNLDLHSFNVDSFGSLELISMEPVDEEINIDSKSVQYILNFNFINGEEAISFEYIYRIDFKLSKREFLFNSLSKENIDISFLEELPFSYFENLINSMDYSAEYAVFDKNDVSSLSLSEEYEMSDIEIRSVSFNKQNVLNQKEVAVKVKVYSDVLAAEKIVDSSFKMNVNENIEAFNYIKSKDIEIINKSLIDSYPVPILNVSDFWVRPPFKIEDMTSYYNIDNSLVKCEFIISYMSKTRKITKSLYFGNVVEKNMLDNKKYEYSRILNSLKPKDLLVSYDKKKRDFYIDPDVSISNKIGVFAFEVLGWKISKSAKKVNLKIQAMFGNERKILNKTIKYNVKLSREEKLKIREAQYGK